MMSKEEPSLRLFTSKQMGDACEMLIAAELTLAGIPALKVPDNWPHYDVIAQPLNAPPQRLSVKSRTFKSGPAYVTYNRTDEFDWLASVILRGNSPQERDIYIIPRDCADSRARIDNPNSKTANLMYNRIDEMHYFFGKYKDNFCLNMFDGPLPDRKKRKTNLSI